MRVSGPRFGVIEIWTKPNSAREHTHTLYSPHIFLRLSNSHTEDEGSVYLDGDLLGTHISARCALDSQEYGVIEAGKYPGLLMSQTEDAVNGLANRMAPAPLSKPLTKAKAFLDTFRPHEIATEYDPDHDGIPEGALLRPFHDWYLKFLANYP